jgi:hypothetical protein
MTERTVTRSIYDFAALTVSRDGATYPLLDLPEKERNALALRGLGYLIGQHETPQTFYNELKAGERSVAREPKKEVIEPWREAGAIVHAEATVKGRGIKAAPGKKLRDTPEFLAELETARAFTKEWSREALAKAKKHPAVMAEYERITGKGSSLEELFRVSETVAKPEPAAEELSLIADAA